MLETFNFRIIQEYMPQFLDGTLTTAWLSGLGILGAMLIGGLACAGRLSRHRFIRLPASAYIEFIRSTPLLAQLYFFYFGLPNLGLRLSEVETGVLALALNSGAYVAEILRSGIKAISYGQIEAATACGLTLPQRLTYIIMPQALGYSIPPLLGQAIVLVKDSALLSLISVMELTRAGQTLNSDRFMPAEAFFTVAFFYLVLYYVLKFITEISRSRLNRHRRGER